MIYFDVKFWYSKKSIKVEDRQVFLIFFLLKWDTGGSVSDAAYFAVQLEQNEYLLSDLLYK